MRILIYKYVSNISLSRLTLWRRSLRCLDCIRSILPSQKPVLSQNHFQGLFCSPSNTSLYLTVRLAFEVVEGIAEVDVEAGRVVFRLMKGLGRVFSSARLYFGGDWRPGTRDEEDAEARWG